MSETSGLLGLQVALATGCVVMLQRPKGLLVRGMQEGVIMSPLALEGLASWSCLGVVQGVIVWLHKNELGPEAVPVRPLVR